MFTIAQWEDKVDLKTDQGLFSALWFEMKKKRNLELQ